MDRPLKKARLKNLLLLLLLMSIAIAISARQGSGKMCIRDVVQETEVLKIKVKFFDYRNWYC